MNTHMGAYGCARMFLHRTDVLASTDVEPRTPKDMTFDDRGRPGICYWHFGGHSRLFKFQPRRGLFLAQNPPTLTLTLAHRGGRRLNPRSHSALARARLEGGGVSWTSAARRAAGRACPHGVVCGRQLLATFDLRTVVRGPP